MRSARVVWSTLVVAFLVSSCSPYLFREVDDGLAHNDGEPHKVKRFYAYGQFCGPGYPVNYGERGKDGRARTLKNLYPPYDDLDAICFAHDYCYTVTNTNHVTCDRVLLHMVIDYAPRFHNAKAKGCWNVATDLVIAFFGKFWERSTKGTETWASRIVFSTMGVPTALFWTVLKTPVLPFLSNPPVREGIGPLGTCNLGEHSDPEKVFADFEDLYKDGLFNDQHNLIEIGKYKDLS